MEKIIRQSKVGGKRRRTASSGDIQAYYTALVEVGIILSPETVFRLRSIKTDCGQKVNNWSF